MSLRNAGTEERVDPWVDKALTERHIAAWNSAIEAAAVVADREWVGENSLIGSKVARKIANAIRDLKMLP